MSRAETVPEPVPPLEPRDMSDVEDGGEDIVVQSWGQGKNG